MPQSSDQQRFIDFLIDTSDLKTPKVVFFLIFGRTFRNLLEKVMKQTYKRALTFLFFIPRCPVLGHLVILGDLSPHGTRIPKLPFAWPRKH